MTQARSSLEQGQAGVAAEPVVDVAADAEREVHLLWLESQDLAAQDLDRGLVVLERLAQQRVVALVAAMDGVGQVQVDEGGLDEVGPALVLGLAQRGRVRRREVEAVERALGRHVVAERSVVVRVVGDVGAASPGGSLPELACLGVGALLGDVDAVGIGLPRRCPRRS